MATFVLFRVATSAPCATVFCREDLSKAGFLASLPHSVVRQSLYCISWAGKKLRRPYIDASTEHELLIEEILERIANRKPCNGAYIFRGAKLK